MLKTDANHLPTFLDEEFSRIIGCIAHRDSKSSMVSKVDVAWHLDHMLKVIIATCAILQKSNPEEFKRSYSFIRTMVFATGYIPRGVAKAPRSVRPSDVIETNGIYDQLATARGCVSELERLDANAHFKHPYFRNINKNQTKRFLKLHTLHHLKIVRDIIKKQT